MHRRRASARPCCRRTALQRPAADERRSGAAARRRHSPRLQGWPAESWGAPIHPFAFLCKCMHIHADGRSQGTPAARDRGFHPRESRLPSQEELAERLVPRLRRHAGDHLARPRADRGREGAPRGTAELSLPDQLRTAVPRLAASCSAIGSARWNQRTIWWSSRRRRDPRIWSASSSTSPISRRSSARSAATTRSSSPAGRDRSRCAGRQVLGRIAVRLAAQS